MNEDEENDRSAPSRTPIINIEGISSSSRNNLGSGTQSKGAMSKSVKSGATHSNLGRRDNYNINDGDDDDDSLPNY
jgi:hypothetical protein